MFVGERMSHPVITVDPDTPINDVLALFKKEHIRRAPVVKNGKMLGIVSESDLLNASPSQATTLSVWEIKYLISKVTVKKVMPKKVITVQKSGHEGAVQGCQEVLGHSLKFPEKAYGGFRTLFLSDT